MATFDNSKGTWWLPDEGGAAYLEGYKVLYEMDVGVYEENPYEKETQEYGDDEACAEDDWAAHEYNQDRQWYRRSHEEG